MRAFRILLKNELRMLLISPPTYIAAVLFLCVMGFLYWAILRGMVNAPETSLPGAQFFSLFWIPVFFVVPLLTMRSIAGERGAGTLDTLMTTPVSRTAVVLGKFAGAYLFYLLLWGATLGFPWITSRFFPSAAASGRVFDAAPLFGGFLFIAASGLLFIAIGIFASSITRSQLVAGMFTFFILFVVIVGGQQLANISAAGGGPAPWLEGAINYLQIFQHLDDFSRGVVDTRPFAYYASTAAVLLGLSTLVIEAKA